MPDTTHLDPKLLEAWQRGGLTTLTIGPLDPTDAKSLRHRLYRVRAAMRRQGHADCAVADQATIALRETGTGQVNVVIYPANLVINQALEAAGLSTNDPPPLED